MLIFRSFNSINCVTFFRAQRYKSFIHADRKKVFSVVVFCSITFYTRAKHLSVYIAKQHQNVTTRKNIDVCYRTLLKWTGNDSWSASAIGGHRWQWQETKWAAKREPSDKILCRRRKTCTTVQVCERSAITENTKGKSKNLACLW